MNRNKKRDTLSIFSNTLCLSGLCGSNLKFIMNRRSFNSALITLTLALLFCASSVETKVFAQSQQSDTSVNSIPTTDSLTPSTRQTVPVVTEQPTPQPTPTQSTTQSTTQQSAQPTLPQPTPQTLEQTVAPAPTQVAPAPSPVPSPTSQSTPTLAPTVTENLPSVPAIAPDYRAPANPLPDIGRVGVDMTDQRPLSLREALEMALSNNKDIEVSRQNVRAAEFDLLGARGAYDPRFSSSTYYERNTTPSASFLSGSSSGAVTQSDITGTARFEGLAPKFGGNYRADFSAVRLTTDNQFAALNPQFPTALTFSYTQPLLRNFHFDSSRRQIEIAKKNLSLTDAQFRQRTIETITQVQRAYWDLVFALRNLQIQRDAVKDARTQLEHNKRMVAEGMLAPIDVVAAEAQVAGYEQSVYSALDDVGRAENNLKNLIAENRQSPFWNVSIIPTDSVDLTPPSVDLTDAMSTALENRPELQQSTAAREINEIDQRYFREQTRPQLDLVGSYGVVGLSGALNGDVTSNPLTASTAQLRARINQLSLLNGLPVLPDPPATVIQDNFIGGFGESFLNLGANRYTNFRVGVQLNLPIRNRTAEAQLGRSLVQGKQIATQREQLEELIQVDVRNALQAVRTAQARLRAASIARSASEQQYTSEQRKFDVGQSTLFLVLERQTALTTARGQELRAQTDLNKSIADLQRATGNSLQANNVVVSAR
jgi:outer membrane protein TolC